MSNIDVQMLKITQVPISQVVAVYQQIPEFNVHQSDEVILSEWQGRIGDRACLCLLACYQGEPVGFKLGYGLSAECFYSWLGGVLPVFRGMGIAGMLRQAQERWAYQAGYQKVSVKTQNRYKAMLAMLIHANYQVVGFEPKEHISHHRLMLEKHLADCLMGDN